MLDSTCQSNGISELERRYIVLTQKGFPIVEEPYRWLAEQLDIPIDKVFSMTKDMLARGIIRRIAAVPNHYKLGYKYGAYNICFLNMIYPINKKINAS